MPRVSAAIITHNRARYLADAITSVLAQTVSDLELIVVDDGSTDGTAEILRSAQLPRVARVLHHDVNRGKGAAVRTALAQARGRYCAIFDADLEYDPADIGVLLEPLLAGEARAAFDRVAAHGKRGKVVLRIAGD